MPALPAAIRPAAGGAGPLTFHLFSPGPRAPDRESAAPLYRAPETIRNDVPVQRHHWP